MVWSMEAMAMNCRRRRRRRGARQSRPSKIWREDADADTDDAATMTCRFGHVGTTFADSSTFPVCRNS
jgi:hypothetical protein